MLAVAGLGDHPPPGSCGLCFQLMLYSWKESIHNPGTLAWQQHSGLFPTAPPVCEPAGNCMCSPALHSGERPWCPSPPSQAPWHAALSVSSTFPCPSCTLETGMPPGPQARAQACRVLSLLRPGFALSQCCGDCCDPLSGLGTIPLPGVDVGGPAAYLLQVENHSLQDGVERLPAALPSGRCRGGESSSDIIHRTERGGKSHPPSQPCHNARHPSPPPGRAARQRCPCAPEPVQAAWLADGAAGRGAAAAPRGQRWAVLPPVLPASLPVLGLTTAPLLGHGDKAALPAR